MSATDLLRDLARDAIAERTGSRVLEAVPGPIVQEFPDIFEAMQASNQRSLSEGKVYGVYVGIDLPFAIRELTVVPTLTESA